MWVLGDELWSLGRIAKFFTAKPIFPGPMFFLYFFLQRYTFAIFNCVYAYVSMNGYVHMCSRP